MRKYRWLALFILLAVALRWGSFFISVINHDESTYIVIADEMLRGEVYLRDVVDTKPIGIFWLYAALIKLTGGAIWALRTAAALVVALGAWGLFLAGRRATGSEKVGVAAGVIYCWACAIFTYYGLSPNTEIFFNLFTIFAVALVVAPRVKEGAADPFWHWPLAGLLLGLAMIVKPFAAAESLAVGLFLVWFYGRRGAYGRLFGSGLALVGAFAIPLVLVYAYYARLGLLDNFFFYTFEVSGAYPVDLPWYLRLKYMGDYLLRYSPFVILGAGALVQYRLFGSRELPRWGYYLLLQFLLVTIVVLLTGKRFGHYQVQLHPVLALLAGLWWAPGVSIFPWLRRERLRKLTPYLVGGLALVLGTVHFFHYQKKTDDPQLMADYLRSRLGEEETFFCLNGRQIAYHLLDKPVPTPYVHSSLLFLDHHLRAFQVDEAAVAQDIIDNPSVTYLVGHTDNTDDPSTIKQLLLEHFTYVETVQDRLVIYRRQ